MSPRTRALGRQGYGWKRPRRSRQRQPAAFAACQQQLAALRQAEQDGHLAVYYVDEVRFSRQAPVPSAGHRRGQPGGCLPAERGAGGYSVLGFWRPADPQATGRHAFTALVSATAFAAELFVRAVAEFVPPLTQPTVLVLDKASIHQAHLVKAHGAAWAAAGLTRLFLPPDSPELNRIEIRWRLCKHYWLTPQAYQMPQTLLQQVTDLLRGIGTTDYQITFG